VVAFFRAAVANDATDDGGYHRHTHANAYAAAGM
jgi:hypothetical protein